MSASTQGLALGVVGATGAVGRELLQVFSERNFPIRELRAYASEASMGEEVELLGDMHPVASEIGSLRGLDLVVLCTPAAVSLEVVREALRAEVSCIDCSSALSTAGEVPLLLSGLSAPSAAVGVPLVATPGGPTMTWARVLVALGEAAGLRGVAGTVVCSVSSAGRHGIEALSNETIALLNQRPTQETECFGHPVAFDCVPATLEPGELGDRAHAASAPEQRLRGELARLLEHAPPLAAQFVQVPTFVGEGSALRVQTERPLSAAEAREVLAKAPELDLWAEDEIGPTTRDSIAQDEVLVGQVREDPSLEHGLSLWAVADPLRLAALNIVKLAETRLHLH